MAESGMLSTAIGCADAYRRFSQVWWSCFHGSLGRRLGCCNTLSHSIDHPFARQASLGGDAKTLMFLNIAPEASAAQESLCSLRFAAKVNACEIGTARRNTGGK